MESTDRTIFSCLYSADGDYAKKGFLRNLPKNVSVVSRMRRNAELHKLPPKHQRCGYRYGTRKKKGNRLPSPKKLARRKKGWQPVTLKCQGREIQRQVLGITCLWPRICGYTPVRLVILRDLSGRQKDDYLFCTDASTPDAQIVQRFVDRWDLEEAIGEGKSLGFEDTRGWCAKTVGRQAPLAMLLVTLVKVWYLKWTSKDPGLRLEKTPWYPQKTQPSFADMLGTLRTVLWQEHAKINMPFYRHLQNTWKTLLYALSAA